MIGWKLNCRNIMDKTKLVATPRCGGHWVNMLINIYIRKLFITEFEFNDNNNVCSHTHDGRLEEKYNNVIYLYRNPVDKIFSEVMYYHKNKIYQNKIHYNNDINDRNYMICQLDMYIEHLEKWMLKENYSKKKTFLCYDLLKNDFDIEFKKVCKHFNVDIDIDKINNLKIYQKEHVKNKIYYDDRIINLKEDYEKIRDEFKLNHMVFIQDYFTTHGKELKKFFCYI